MENENGHPWPAEILKAYLLSRSSQSGPVTAGKAGALIGHLNQVCGGEDRRRLFLQYVYGTRTSNGLFADHYLRLDDWLKPDQIVPEGGGKPFWAVDPACAGEARLVIMAQMEANRQAQIAAGQTALPGF